MFKSIVLAIFYAVATALGILASWEAKRYYTNNRSRIIKSLRAAKESWVANSPVVS